jgi:hypothetical protein
VFSRFSRKKAQDDTAKAIQKGIETELRTFTNHLAQISSAYEVLVQHDLKIIKLLEELNSKK